MAESERARASRMLSSLRSARVPYEDDIWDVASYAAPNRCRFLTNKNGAKRRRIKPRDSHGIGAFRTLANGMQSGLSSSSTPWFALSMDDGIEEDDWLDPVQKLMERRFHLSNFYDVARATYHELGLFGTGAAIMEDHPENLLACHPLTFGEYWVANDQNGVADTLLRRCTMTVKSAVEKFGNAVSAQAKTAYDRSDYGQELDVYHLIERDRSVSELSAFVKPWKSLYWDEGDTVDALLEKSGYHEKPFFAPRWDVVGHDAYGYGPGHDCVAELRELQLLAKRRGEAVDFLAKPEIVVANANIKMARAAGAVTTAPGATSNDVFVPYTMPYQAPQAIREEIMETRGRIDELSHASLFMAITNMAGIQPRNIEEIAARNEEKLTQLGPVIDRVNSEMLSVAVDRLYGIMSRGGFFSEAPVEKQGETINVQFTSILARMQRAVGIGQIERHVGFVGNLLAAFPDAADNLDVDEAVREHAERTGVPHKLSRGTSEVEEIRAGRAQQKQMEQMAAMAPAAQQGADAARLLSETDMGGESALDLVLGR